jgi:hypothetical protein
MEPMMLIFAAPAMIAAVVPRHERHGRRTWSAGPGRVRRHPRTGRRVS